MKKVIYLFVAVFLFSCAKENSNKELGERFFELYSKRKEIDKIVSFYADEFEYENIGFESEADSPRFLYEEFYGWKDPAFKFEDDNTVIVTEIISSSNSIVAKGYTQPYTYNGKYVEGSRFVIWLDLDENSRIVKQTDWFDYPMEEIIEAFYLKRSMTIE